MQATRLPLLRPHGSSLRLRLLLLLSCVIGAAHASPPATLAYQGRLADAGGSPINATLSITFRLYAEASGGSPLWSEVQTNIEVDGGNLAVELGRITPLPASLWGQQLHLGIQIAGDSEMAPRPRLTAAPYALRAGSLQRHTVIVSAEGSALDNGARLLAAVAAVNDASASAPVAIELDAGRYDLGAAGLVLPSYTRLTGKGQAATFITSAYTAPDFAATLRLAPDTEVSDLTAENTAVPANPSDSQVGIGAVDPATMPQPIARVRLHRVTGISRAAPGTPGQRAGISVCAYDSEVTDVKARALGGLFAMGLRADCPAFNLRIDGALIQAADATDGIRGSYFVAGAGNVWRNLDVLLSVPATASTVFGVRFLGAPAVFAEGPQGLLSNSRIEIRGSADAATQTFRAEGVTLENAAQLATIEHTTVLMRDVRAQNIDGIRLRDSTSNDAPRAATRLHDVRIVLRARQENSLGGGETSGVSSEAIPPRISQSHIQVECLVGDVSPCLGVWQEGIGVSPGNSPPLRIENSEVEVAHLGAGGGASAAALQVGAAARVENSRLRLTRSAGNENVRVISLWSPSAQVRLHRSTVIGTDEADSNSVCVLAGPTGSNSEWYGNHVQGIACDGGQVNRICAGNTQRGFGFLAGSCP